ncbi:MAG: hypothetical protein EHM72_02590 [Calditrichaeota bacterium]|nr:MAG: hypothetical protein EHM72_02590 [Calditrichota bacterium]
MQKRIVLLIMLSLLCFQTLPAKQRFYFNTGINKPLSPSAFKDYWRSGFNLGAGTGFVLNPHFEIAAVFSFDQMQLDDNAFLKSITQSNDVYSSVLGGTTSIFDIIAALKYKVPTPNHPNVTPYLTAAMGVSDKIIGKKEVSTEEDYFEEARENDILPSAGIGMGFEIVTAKNTSLVIEGSFQFLFGKETTIYFPLKFGIVLN